MIEAWLGGIGIAAIADVVLIAAAALLVRRRRRRAADRR